MEAAGKYNTRNPAVKRILQEIKEMAQDTSGEFVAEALEDNIFEWQFAIRGPPETEFEGGIYHGRIVLPPEYPFKPPSFIMLSPNGRFEIGTKICLSISQHHPEEWQPSWSVRTALTALIAFFPTPGNGALGSLDWSKDDRKALALKSRKEPPIAGSEQRVQLIKDLHERLLSLEQSNQPQQEEEQSAPAAVEDNSVSPVQYVEVPQTNQVVTDSPPVLAQPSLPIVRQVQPNQPWETTLTERQPSPWEERLLTLIAGAIAALIAAILVKKILVNFGVHVNLSSLQ